MLIYDEDGEGMGDFSEEWPYDFVCQPRAVETPSLTEADEVQEKRWFWRSWAVVVLCSVLALLLLAWIVGLRERTAANVDRAVAERGQAR